MIALDTNVLIRHMVRDDLKQADVASRLIEATCTPEEPGIITLIVLCEMVWVLDQGYGYGRDAITKVLQGMLSADDLQVERSDLAWQALNRYETGKAGFADYLIGLCGKDEGARVTYTFDKRASESELFEVIRIDDQRNKTYAKRIR